LTKAAVETQLGLLSLIPYNT